MLAVVVLFALLGLLVGGLVNQLGSDLPGRQRLSRPHCRYCGRNYPWWQWVSLPSYLVGRTACSSCGASIRLRRPLVELGLAVAYAYLWIELGLSIKLAFYLAYTAAFAVILITDFERRLILNVVTYPAILLAVVASLLLPDMTWQSALAGGAIAFAFFYATALVGKAVFGSGAMGGGDVTLATFIGLVTGFPLVIEALVLTIIIGGAISLMLWITRVRSLGDHVPYGPFLVAGAFVTMLWGYPIAEWFLRR